MTGWTMATKISRMNVLTVDEQSQFKIIATNASREGWISSSAELVAQPSNSGSDVTITATRGSEVVRRTYPRDERWPFQVLRDLAWGSFKT
jgi:hypothetical protein